MINSGAKKFSAKGQSLLKRWRAFPINYISLPDKGEHTEPFGLKSERMVLLSTAWINSTRAGLGRVSWEDVFTDGLKSSGLIRHLPS
jgi:hypothetical protein